MALRAYLIAAWLVLAIYTGLVISEHGLNLLPIFFADMAKFGWPGQFNLDFMILLTISALWTAWRNGAAPDFLSEMLVGALEASQMADGVTPDLLARAFEHLAHFGSDTEVWVALATFNRRAGQPQDALQCLEHARASLAFPLPHPSAYAAVRAQPSRIDEERGHTLVALRHFREAYAAFLGVLEHKPDDSPGWPELLNLAPETLAWRARASR